MTEANDWTSRIRDLRRRRVVFAAHCLLNTNTRYLGGACRGGAVREIVEGCLQHEIGIVQLPCPEQHAWGGVVKRRLLYLYGSEGKLRYKLGRLMLPILLWRTRRLYRKLARRTAWEIEDYQQAGFAVLGVIGVDASPTCGVQQSLDMREALSKIARLNIETATSEKANAVVRETAIAGRGLFIEALADELGLRKIRVPFAAHSIMAELRGEKSPVNIGALLENAS